jgi:hypothetical protein
MPLSRIKASLADQYADGLTDRVQRKTRPTSRKALQAGALFPVARFMCCAQPDFMRRRLLLLSALCLLGPVCMAASRTIRIVCTQGPHTLEKYGLPAFDKALDFAGRHGADLGLLPEYVNGEMLPEPLDGPSARLMASKAREYRLYVAGTIAREDCPGGVLHNTALLFGRDGILVGSYDKIHLYGDEVVCRRMELGVTVPGLDTDFGRVDFIVCNDIAFEDVAEGVAEGGAWLALFPNLGYNPDLPARRTAANDLWVAASSRSGRHNIYIYMGKQQKACPDRHQTCRRIPPACDCARLRRTRSASHNAPSDGPIQTVIPDRLANHWPVATRLQR